MTENEFETTKSNIMNVKNKKMKSSPMMEMMSSMMGGMQRSKMGGNPMRNMCAEMMGGMSKTSKEDSYSTDELMDLFKDWCSQVEDEIVSFIKETGDTNDEKIAEKFNLSKESVTHLLKNLKKAGRV